MGRWRTGIASLSKSFRNVFARRAREPQHCRSSLGRRLFLRAPRVGREVPRERATRAPSSPRAAAALGPLRGNHLPGRRRAAASSVRVAVVDAEERADLFQSFL